MICHLYASEKSQLANFHDVVSEILFRAFIAGVEGSPLVFLTQPACLFLLPVMTDMWIGCDSLGTCSGQQFIRSVLPLQMQH